MNTAAPRAWQRMLSGRRLDLLDPSPLDIEIEDIAHGLARVARWNGQTKGDHAFSVAQHCVVGGSHLCPHQSCGHDRATGWWRLLHDAPEYVVGDMISPFKAALGVDYKAFENRLLSAIHLRFGLPAVAAHETWWTRSSQQIERRPIWRRRNLPDLPWMKRAAFSARPKGLTGLAPEFSHALSPLPATKAASQYLDVFGKLLNQS